MSRGGSRFTSGMKSSARQDWRTPQVLFATLDREFGFTLDAAADDTNALSEDFHTSTTDGIGQSWNDQTVWLNPPYKYTGAWMAKARREAQNGAIVVCLVPARCDTSWWNAEVVPYATEIRFIRGRLCFDDSGNSAPFPSAVVVFYGVNADQRISTINKDGSPFRLPVVSEQLI